MNFRIHHVAITVRDMDEAIAWWQANFDAEVPVRYEKHGLELAQVVCGEVRIELFAGSIAPLPEHAKEVQSDIRVIGTKHVCLETGNLDALMTTLKEKGVKFATEPDTAGFGGRYVFIKDPSGTLIELYQR